MDKEILVKYNGNLIYPTPLINRNLEMVDLADGRWGNVEAIELKGVLTGITSPNDYLRITSIFTGNFGELIVTDSVNELYRWKSLAVENISFDSSRWPIGGFTNYSVSLKSFNIPSGVLDATNEYGFTQSEDGTVSVNHKISAKGVNTPNFNALTNAILFVNQFTGKNPYTNCVPVFIPNGNGILMSLNESIDRLSQTYTVTETYKFTTGFNGTFIETSTISVDESSSQDYISIDLNARYQTSTVTGDLSQLQSSISSIDFLSKIAQYGIETGSLYRTSASINRNSGAASVDVKLSYTSGISPQDALGFFDYTVSVDKDEITQRNIWKIDGEFICKGPITFKKERVDNFKNSIISSHGNYEQFLINTIATSILYENYSTHPIVYPPSNFSIQENTGLATLRLSATFSDIENPYNLINPSVSVQFEPSHWVYDVLPSANIEGHYVIQDLQTKSAPKITLNVSSDTNGSNPLTESSLKEILTILSGAYVTSGFLTQDTSNTGYNQISIEQQFTAKDIPNSNNITNYKVHGAFATNYTREAGYKFGY